jgi:hypothetical protein
LRRRGYRVDPAREEGRHVHDEAAVALAFAELKLRGKCRAAVAALARAAMQRQRQEALADVQWPHREDRLRSLELLEANSRAAALDGQTRSGIRKNPPPAGVHGFWVNETEVFCNASSCGFRRSNSRIAGSGNEWLRRSQDL